MNKNLYMLASFGNFKRIPAGGGQTAARRLLNTLRDVGFDVSIFNRHRLYFQNKILDRISMLIGVAIDPILFFFYQPHIHTIRSLCHFLFKTPGIP